MKRSIRIMTALAACTSLAVFGGCSTSQTSDQTSETQDEFVDAQALLLKVWNTEEEDSKPAVFGGVGENIAEDEPLALDLADAQLLSQSLAVPESLVEASKSASSMMNAMMANSFTASCWQLKDASNISNLAKEVSEQVENNHWICSFPESYQIIQQGSFLILVYGIDDQVNPFVDALMRVCPDAVVLYNEPIAG